MKSQVSVDRLELEKILVDYGAAMQHTDSLTAEGITKHHFRKAYKDLETLFQKEQTALLDRIISELPKLITDERLVHTDLNRGHNYAISDVLKTLHKIKSKLEG